MMALGANFGGELQGIYNLLLTLFDLSECISSLHSHLQIKADNFENLLIS
jgi:hypothetical protein